MVIGSLSQRELIQPKRAAMDIRRLNSCSVVIERTLRYSPNSRRIPPVLSQICLFTGTFCEIQGHSFHLYPRPAACRCCWVGRTNMVLRTSPK